MALSSLSSFLLWWFITKEIEYIPRIMTLSQANNYVYLNHHPHFRIENGLWLMPIGIFAFCCMWILDLPEKYGEIHMMIKKR